MARTGWRSTFRGSQGQDGTRYASWTYRGVEFRAVRYTSFIEGQWCDWTIHLEGHSLWTHPQGTAKALHKEFRWIHQALVDGEFDKYLTDEQRQKVKGKVKGMAKKRTTMPEIARVASFAGTDVTRHHLIGVYMDPTTKRAYASDGHRLIVCRPSYIERPKGQELVRADLLAKEFNMVPVEGAKWPIDSVKTIIKDAFKEDPYRISFTIPKWVSDLKTKHFVPITLSVGEGRAEVLATALDRSREHEISLNAVLLAPLAGETVTVFFRNANSPIAIVPHEGNTRDPFSNEWFAVVMPMRGDKTSHEVSSAFVIKSAQHKTRWGFSDCDPNVGKKKRVGYEDEVKPPAPEPEAKVEPTPGVTPPPWAVADDEEYATEETVKPVQVTAPRVPPRPPPPPGKPHITPRAEVRREVKTTAPPPKASVKSRLGALAMGGRT